MRILCFSLYCSLSLCQETLKKCIFGKILVSKCPSWAMLYNHGSVEGLYLETIATDGNCKIFPVELSLGILLVIIMSRIYSFPNYIITLLLRPRTANSL
jgi:hypothetical protein